MCVFSGVLFPRVSPMTERACMFLLQVDSLRQGFSHSWTAPAFSWAVAAEHSLGPGPSSQSVSMPPKSPAF